MKNIIFLAPPAGGKGTQSEYLVKDYDYLHISAGDLLREFAKGTSVMAQQVKKLLEEGQMIYDETTISLIDEKINKEKGRHFIFDGFPRNIVQARKFSVILNKNNIEDYEVIYLKLDENTALKRALGRVNCSCGKIYNLYDEELKPSVDGYCDACGGILDKRDDDNEESFKTRFNLYLKNIDILVDYYENTINKKVIVIDATKSPEEVYKDIKVKLNDIDQK